jgi:hypothetical protein
MREVPGFDEKILQFYLGEIDDDQRTEMEELLFSSREKLAEFIALKRTFEVEDLPVGPSQAFQRRLRTLAAKQFIREDRGFLKFWIPVGAVAVVLLIVIGVFKIKSATSTRVDSSAQGISFDSGGDAAVSLKVL